MRLETKLATLKSLDIREKKIKSHWRVFCNGNLEAILWRLDWRESRVETQEVVWSNLLHYSKYERGSTGLSNVLNMVGKRNGEVKGDIQEAT